MDRAGVLRNYGIFGSAIDRHRSSIAMAEDAAAMLKLIKASEVIDHPAVPTVAVRTTTQPSMLHIFDCC